MEIDFIKYFSFGEPLFSMDLVLAIDWRSWMFLPGNWRRRIPIPFSVRVYAPRWALALAHEGKSLCLSLRYFGCLDFLDACWILISTIFPAIVHLRCVSFLRQWMLISGCVHGRWEMLTILPAVINGGISYLKEKCLWVPLPRFPSIYRRMVLDKLRIRPLPRATAQGNLICRHCFLY